MSNNDFRRWPQQHGWLLRYVLVRPFFSYGGRLRKNAVVASFPSVKAYLTLHNIAYPIIDSSSTSSLSHVMADNPSSLCADVPTRKYLSLFAFESVVGYELKASGGCSIKK